MTQTLGKQVMDQTTGGETNQGITMNVKDVGVAGDRKAKTTENQVGSVNLGYSNNFVYPDECQSCFVTEQLAPSQNMKFSLNTVCDKIEPDNVIIPTKSMHCNGSIRVTHPQATGSSQAREETDCQKIQIASSNDGRNCDKNETPMNGASCESCLADGVSTHTTNSFHPLTFNEFSLTKKHYGQDIAGEMLYVDFPHKDENCVSHSKSVCDKVDRVVDIDTNRFCHQNGQEMFNQADSMCGKSVAVLTEHRPVGVEGLLIETNDSHNSGSFNTDMNKCESGHKVLFQNKICDSSHNVSVDFRTEQQSKHHRMQSFNNYDDSSGNINHMNVILDRTHGQENSKSDNQDILLTSKSLTSSEKSSDVINETNLIGVTNKVHLTVRSDNSSFKVLDKLIIKKEPQASTASVTNSLTMKAPSSAESEHIQTVCDARKSSPDTADDVSLLNFLKKNCVRAGNSLQSESPCKVVTKYVFINKPSLHLPNKKGFGVLYKQAFRHYIEAKQKRKKIKQFVSDKRTRKESTNKQVIEKKKSLFDSALKESFLQQQNRETRNKCREERRLSREIKKNATKDLNERVNVKTKERKIQKKKTKNKVSEAEMTEDKRNKTKSSKKGKQNQKTLKLHCNLEKIALKKPLEENPIRESTRKGNGISRTQVWKILKRKQKIHTEKVDGLMPKVKKSKKHKKKIGNADLEIKLEVTDEEKEDNANSIDDIVDEDVPFQQMKAKMRYRKDLTLQEKVEAIGALEMPGSKLIAVAKRFGVSVSAISRINKNREYILLQSVSGDLNSTQRRSRECKDPELDKVLLRWFRIIESLRSPDTPINISNVLLKEKAHELAITMGKNYFPSDNWIIRWKNRHNIGRKSKVVIIIQDRDELKQFDCQVNISEVLEEMGKQEFKIDQVKRESLMRRSSKPEELFICEHCGVLTSSKKKKVNNHLVGCPASSVRKDLTLEEKVQVVRALEHPGVKMVTLAKKYGVSASAISRIHKNRVNILARRASGLANSARRRDRGSKEPEVERVLCEWFKVQHELGIHISGSMIREKARDIARVMGKDFWPSESWVFRWRHRNNVTDVNTFLYGDSGDEELGCLERSNDNLEDVAFSNSGDYVAGDKCTEGEGDAIAENSERGLNKFRKEKAVPEEMLATKQFRLPRSVMCEKCGFVSNRVKNNRIKSLRHAKGCPDLKPRNELTYENRARMLKSLEEPGATLSSVARQFGVSVSSMSRMNQKKDQILSHSEEHASQKRIRDCKEPEVAYSLYQWYMQKKTEGVHITGPKLKEKATKFAAEMGREFNASSGWLGRWRHRYNIISSVKTADRIDPAKRRKCRKSRENKLRNSDHCAQLHAITCDPHHDSPGSAASAIVESLDPVPTSQQSHATPVFIHQRFPNPWEIAQQQDESCVWTKEFLTPAGPSILDDAAVSVAYTYGETVSKPIFQNVFDSFSAVGYQVAMPLDPSMIVSRDYLKQDVGEDKYGSSTLHISHPSHSQQSHHLSANLSAQHLHHHVALSHPHSLSHTQQPQVQPQSQVTLTMPPPSPAALEDDPEQQRQVMEAFKIMSSFAQKKSLGDQVQAALRTIEMSMKSSARKTSSSTPRTSYTSI